EINILQSGKYILSDQSLQFPQFLLKQAIPQYIEASKVDGKVAIMKQFRGWIREQIAA
ncbi:MAG: Uma2 family endonuclease, partial [Cyanobacteria bacterium]|nr:Uma2 family endonuclease [Cyanobacteria bacterium GSL.Bin21]